MSSNIHFVGNPNAGKTLLFNLLTGQNAKVANFPGVTIEKKTGSLSTNPNIQIVDLPGIYSLSACSQDEAITIDAVEKLASSRSVDDKIIAIVDATQLKKGLFLVAELVEKGWVDAVALTMGDLVSQSLPLSQIKILSDRIGVPVFLLSATKRTGVTEFVRFLNGSSLRATLRNPEILDGRGLRPCSDSVEHHHSTVDTWLAGFHVNVSRLARWSQRIDKFALHPIIGPILLVLIFGLLFEVLFVGSKPFVELIDFCKTHASDYVSALFPPESLAGSLISKGIIDGVGSVLAFVPLIALLFLFLSALEDSGYMARAVFLLHRLMSRVGLSGKAFVPIVSGFSCSVPAILSTRIIESRAERLTSILVTPLIPCSARLPIYTMLIGAAFASVQPLWGFVDVGALTMVGMYFGGVLLAFLTAGIFRKTILRGKPTPLIMELPNYRLPRARNLWFAVKTRVLIFIKEAGTVILALTILLWALFTFPLGAGGMEHSYAGQFGRLIEPLIQPLGFDWRIGVSLIASFAAREVFISTFGIIYGLEQLGRDASTLWQSDHPVYSPLVAVSLLAFLAVALQCISTVAVTRKETGSWRWPLFQLGYLNSLAWLLAFGIFQTGRVMGF